MISRVYTKNQGWGIMNYKPTKDLRSDVKKQKTCDLMNVFNQVFESKLHLLKIIKVLVQHELIRRVGYKGFNNFLLTVINKKKIEGGV